MKKMFLLFSHELTQEQIYDAVINMDVEEFVYLPEELQEYWSNVNPYDNSRNNLLAIWQYLDELIKIDDYILLQGEWYYVYQSIEHFKNKVNLVYSSTERIVIESPLSNGEINKQSFFKHIKYKSFFD
jgi:hypothetical protein